MTDLITAPELHVSHVGLLAVPGPTTARAPVDAVIVPTARPAVWLTTAIRLAEELGAPLIALCSQDADPAAVHDKSWDCDATVIAAAVSARRPPALPKLGTTSLVAESPFRRASDTSVKRNVALAVSRMTGWRRVLFLDDDISGVTADAVREAASWLGPFDVVGLSNGGYFDNSVVCHANRDTGGVQEMFVGGGAMLFAGGPTASFFPDIYNEDWFFLLGSDRLRKVAASGTYRQERYDPYANAVRARQEEFGDTLAEGIYALLDDRGTIADADAAYWRAFLPRRAEFIDAVAERVCATVPAGLRQTRMIAALRASRTSLDLITPDLCVKYLRAWRRDRRRWAEYLGPLKPDRSPGEALACLGLKVWETTGAK